MSETLDDPKVRRAYERLIKLIYIRLRSIKEAKDFLKRALNNKFEHDSLIIEVLIERLIKLDYLNDNNFAKWWVEQRVNSPKSKSKLSIAHELRNKGIDSDIIENTINKFDFSEIENLAIEKEIAKKLKALRRKTNDKRILKARLYSHLRQKGFNSSDIVKQLDAKL